jgi:peptidyl-prolyl cis-trans isomerase C
MPNSRSFSRLSSVFSAAACFSLVSDAVAAPGAASEPVATFAGAQITVGEVQAVISQQVPVEQARIAREGGARAVLERMLRYDLLVNEARARGYEKNPAVQEEVRRKAANTFGLSRTQVDPKTLPADQVASVRAARTAQFSRPAMRRAMHVVVASRAEAEALIPEVKKLEGPAFSRIASARSLDPRTRHQGGELGYFTQDNKTENGADAGVPLPLVAAAFKLKEAGAVVAAPIELPEGFSVLMLTGVMPAFAPSVAQMDDEARERLVATGQRERLDALIKELEAEYKPAVHAELLDSIQLPSDTTGATAQLASIPEGFPAYPPDPREPPKLVEPDGF